MLRKHFAAYRQHVVLVWLLEHPSSRDLEDHEDDGAT